MRKQLALPLLSLVLTCTGCDDATGPVSRDLAGTWESQDFAAAVVRMTVSEIALAVDGAGSWSTAQTAEPFAVSGANVEGQLSLIFDFETPHDIGFQGAFTDDDTLEGSLVASGRGFRNEPITFVRVRLE